MIQYNGEVFFFFFTTAAALYNRTAPTVLLLLYTYEARVRPGGPTENR